MKLVKNAIEFLKKEDGPTAVEYAVMLALIIVVCIAAITAIGTNANSTFSQVGSTLGGTASYRRRRDPPGRGIPPGRLPGPADP